MMETTTNTTNVNDLAIVIGSVRNGSTIRDMLDKVMNHYRPARPTIYMRTAIAKRDDIYKWADERNASVMFIDSPDWIVSVDFERTMLGWYKKLFNWASCGADRKVLLMDIDPCNWGVRAARVAAFAANEGFDLATVSDNGFAKIDDYDLI